MADNTTIIILSVIASVFLLLLFVYIGIKLSKRQIVVYSTPSFVNATNQETANLYTDTLQKENMEDKNPIFTRFENQYEYEEGETRDIFY